MINRISIENFKGIGPRVDVDLKPVTLLFGPNSSGKSTILHAMQYAHAVLDSGNPDVYRSQLGGSADFGGFIGVLHGYDKSQEIRIGLEFTVLNNHEDGAPIGFDTLWDAFDLSHFVDRKLLLCGSDDSAECEGENFINEFQSWFDPAEEVFSKEYVEDELSKLQIQIGDVSEMSKEEMRLDDLNPNSVRRKSQRRSLMLNRLISPDKAAMDMRKFEGDMREEMKGRDCAHTPFAEARAEQAECAVGITLSLGWSEAQKAPIVTQYAVSYEGHQVATLVASTKGKGVWVTGIGLANPHLWGKDVDMGEEEAPAELRRGPTRYLIPCSGQWAGALPLGPLGIAKGLPERGEVELSDLDVFLGNSLKLLVHELEQSIGVGPIRTPPPRNYKPVSYAERARWVSGLAAWDALFYGATLRSQVNQWLTGPKAMGTGYRIELNRYREVSSGVIDDFFDSIVKAETSEQVAQFRERFPELARMVLIDERRGGIEMEACDLGEGISQVVPVIAAALIDSVSAADGLSQKVGLVAIEQPELHIHPRMQVALGDLFLTECRKKQFLVETHSEHLMLRLLRRVRETTEGGLPEGAPEADTGTVSVLYVDQIDGSTTITPLPISEDGDFMVKWPGGFFEERAEELFG